jgi:prolycopene isomerase
MSVRGDAGRDSYDVVVVGSGMGGLTAAALLARAGRSVLVVERHDRLGGYAHAFSRRGRYHFDSAVHMTPGGLPQPDGTGGGVVYGLLRLLGVADDCQFHKLEPFFSVVFPGLRMDIPTGPEYLDAHVEQFPAERAGLRKWMRASNLVTREALRLPPDLSPQQLAGAPDLPLHRRYADATVADVLDEHLTDPRLKAVLTALWPYVGVPPSRASYPLWAPMISTFVQIGATYAVGSFQKMVNAMAASLTANGGEVLLRTTVRRILTEGGRVTGVKLDNGQQVAAGTVISNGDPLQTFEELVGVEAVDPDYLRRIRSSAPSLSAAVMFLATDLDLAGRGLAHETFLFDDWDHDETYRRVLAGEPSGLAVTIPTLADPSLAPAGQHVLTVTSLLHYDAVGSWRQAKPAYERMLMDKLEAFIPGIGERIRFSEGATPRTMERYTLNVEGSAYGWEPTPEQSCANRLPHRTPVEGLYLSSHWTRPGGGLLPVLVSGIETTELVTGEAVLPEIVALRTPAVPGPGAEAVPDRMPRAS